MRAIVLISLNKGTLVKEFDNEEALRQFYGEDEFYARIGLFAGDSIKIEADSHFDYLTVIKDTMIVYNSKKLAVSMANISSSIII